ncbi:MAG: hypothetical protein H7061_01595 [Bdellovibrionaceae bacterium]|nr:hypothetical protein [Bdellovibrio sp.]
MRSINYIFIPVCVSLVTSGCFPVHTARDPKAAEVVTNENEGGQPGKVTVGGAAVPLLQKRIMIELNGGNGINGSPAPLKKSSTPEIMAQVSPTTDLNEQSHANSLLAIGCAATEVQEYAQNNNLKIEKVPDTVDDTLTLRSNTVMFCGKTTFNVSQLVVQSHHVIMTKATLALYGIYGGIEILTNSLTMNGKNKIETKGIKLTVSSVQAPDITLIVYNEISETDGTLVLRSTGTKYTTGKY